MKIKNKGIILSLLFPVLVLLGITIYKDLKTRIGKTIIIPIEGYDPRDLLSGHYLTYRLDLPHHSICESAYKKGRRAPVYVCLKQLSDNKLSAHTVYSIESGRESCDAVLKGRCDNGLFVAGIERFYIPEEHAARLDKVFRGGKGKLVVSIDTQGKASIKDLLIENKPWKEWLNSTLP